MMNKPPYRRRFTDFTDALIPVYNWGFRVLGGRSYKVFRQHIGELAALTGNERVLDAVGDNLMEQQSLYYLSQQDKLLKELAGFAKLMQPELAARYGEPVAVKVRQDTLAEYEKLLPLFPYIGGKANPLTTNLVQAGYVLALYRALQAHGGTFEEAGELSCLALQRKLKQIPAFVRRWLGQFAYSPARVQKMQARAQASQARRYPGDWVFEVIEGDGKMFDIGMTYTECGIDKFMRSQGAAELTPYLCNLDYVTFAAFGMGLLRTKTLGWGCDCCDFRIQRKGAALPAWPPRFVERTCGQG